MSLLSFQPRTGYIICSIDYRSMVVVFKKPRADVTHLICYLLAYMYYTPTTDNPCAQFRSPRWMMHVHRAAKKEKEKKRKKDKFLVLCVVGCRSLSFQVQNKPGTFQVGHNNYLLPPVDPTSYQSLFAGCICGCCYPTGYLIRLR